MLALPGRRSELRSRGRVLELSGVRGVAVLMGLFSHGFASGTATAPYVWCSFTRLPSLCGTTAMRAMPGWDGPYAKEHPQMRQRVEERLSLVVKLAGRATVAVCSEQSGLAEA